MICVKTLPVEVYYTGKENYDWEVQLKLYDRLFLVQHLGFKLIRVKCEISARLV